MFAAKKKRQNEIRLPREKAEEQILENPFPLHAQWTMLLPVFSALLGFFFVLLMKNEKSEDSGKFVLKLAFFFFLINSNYTHFRDCLNTNTDGKITKLISVKQKHKQYLLWANNNNNKCYRKYRVQTNRKTG